MRKAGKIFCLTLGCGLALTAFAACGDAGKNPGSKGDTVTMVVWLPKEDQEFGRQVANEYKAAHPEKKYNFQFGEQSESDAGTRVLQDVTNAPDVFAFASDHITKLVNGGALNRIGGQTLERIKAANTPESVDAATVTVKSEGQSEEQTYAMPFTDNTFFLYYNKAKLSEADVATIDGILAKCDATHQFGYPMNDGWYSSAFYFGKELGYEVEYDEAFGETKITTDFGNEIGEAVTEAIWQLVMNPKVKADSDDSKAVAGFQDGSMIAAVSGIWNKNAIQEALGDNFGVAKLPTYTLDGEQVQLTAFAGYKLFGVSNYSPNKAEALAFAEFFTNKENQLKHFDVRGYNPTNIEAAADAKILNDPCVKAIQGTLEHCKPQKNVPTTLWTPLQSLGNDMITKKGKFDLKTQLAALVTSIQKNATEK
jgi:arabinogalactan oligomer/maltooligosaccharide transport system substrate-binding protein